MLPMPKDDQNEQPKRYTKEKTEGERRAILGEPRDRINKPAEYYTPAVPVKPDPPVRKDNE